MDFSDLSLYPIVADPDYSPTMDSFTYPDNYDKAYLADAYTNQPDYTFDSFFDQPVSSIEFSSGYPSSKSTSTFNPALPSPTTPWPVDPTATTTTTTFNQFPQTYPFESATANTTTTTPLDQGQSSTRTSPTPSLCGDAPLPQTTQPLNLKRESPSSPPFAPSEPSPKRPLRKRGRPRLNRTTSAESSFSPPSSTTHSMYTKHQQGAPSSSSSSKRLPHNQVERKYREGLNSELERLRRAVPTLPQGASGSQGDENGATTSANATASTANNTVLGQPKPSKAMVLAGAIEYIKRLEREKEDAVRECEVLRRERDELRVVGQQQQQQQQGGGGGGGWGEEWRSDVY